MNFLSSLYQSDGTIVATMDDGRVFSVSTDHPLYRKVKAAYKVNDADTFVHMASQKFEEQKACEELKTVSGNRVTVSDGVVYVDGHVLHNSISDSVRRLYTEGIDYKPLVRFIENFLSNPSYNSREQLWGFIEQLGLTITEDGCFLGYKGVRDDYYDKYTGRTHVNKPGAVIREPREEISDNPGVACAKGLHVGALTYASSWAGCDGRLVIVKVNPRDVVSVPNDHSCQKLRCCEYTVVSDYKGELKKCCYTGNVDSLEYDSDYEEEYDDDDDQYVECPEDMLVGHCYQFDYYKEDSTKTRYGMVEEHTDETLIVRLIEPEENAGKYRQFRYENIEEIYEIERS